MSNPPAVITYQFESLADVRAIKIKGEPWFIAQDICRAMDIKDVSSAVEPLDDDEKARKVLTLTNTGQREVLIVSESGLYTMILRSRQATTPGSLAHRFRRWVTKEVLPAIRKTGSYSVYTAEQRAYIAHQQSLVKRYVAQHPWYVEKLAYDAIEHGREMGGELQKKRGKVYIADCEQPEFLQLLQSTPVLRVYRDQFGTIAQTPGPRRLT